MEPPQAAIEIRPAPPDTKIPNSSFRIPNYFLFTRTLKLFLPVAACIPTGLVPWEPFYSKSSGEVNSPSGKILALPKCLDALPRDPPEPFLHFRFTRTLKLFLPVAACSTAMEYLISSRPPRSLRLCRRVLVWMSTDNSP
mgnify:CR=1 FL=1